MIVQSSPEGQPHFVIEQIDHARSCGQLARAFGNADFLPPEPRDLVIYLVDHHDEGWIPIDARCELSPITGLPNHLTQTPIPYLIQTSKGSPDFNENHHPYCGLLSSMHTYGLFNGRYGLSDFVFIDNIPAEHRAIADAMLADELARQERLKTILSADSATKAWIDEGALLRNYKLLQFFDTLGLYFHMNHADHRQESRFLNVPDGKGSDHTVVIYPRGDGSYVLTPWVFAEESLEIVAMGRYITPQPPETDFKELFVNTPKEQQVYRLVRN